METIITSKIVLTPLIPLVTALLIMASKNKPNLRESWSVCGAVLTFLSVDLSIGCLFIAPPFGRRIL